MVAALESWSREDLRGKVQGTFGRRLLTPREFEDESRLVQLPRSLRSASLMTYRWAKDELASNSPIAKDAFEQDSIYFSIGTPEDLKDFQAIASELRQHADIFSALDPRFEPEVESKVLVAIFPKLAELESMEGMVQLKAEFIRQGALLHEYQPQQESSNTTLFLFRYLTEADWAEVEDEEAWKKAFIQRLGEVTPRA